MTECSGFPLIAAALLAVSAASAQNISGEWCTESSPVDCVFLLQATTNAEILSAELRTATTKTYAQAAGYFRKGLVVLSFRRLDTADIGHMTLTIPNNSYADGRSFHPDGSLRWQGRYKRKTVVLAGDLKTEQPVTVATPPAKPASASTATAAGGKPVGCFADKDPRDLGSATTWAPNADACIAFCASKGFRYAAKQAGTHCFCGNSYGRYGASTACVPCRGLNAEHCGGSYANYVWEVVK